MNYDFGFATKLTNWGKPLATSTILPMSFVARAEVFE